MKILASDLFTIDDSFNDLSMIKITHNVYTFDRKNNELKAYTNNLVDAVSELLDIIITSI